MRKSVEFKRIIEGVKFTFKCVRNTHIDLNGHVHYIRRWFWGPDCFSTKSTGIDLKFIRLGIKYQVQAAKMEFKC